MRNHRSDGGEAWTSFHEVMKVYAHQMLLSVVSSEIQTSDAIENVNRSLLISLRLGTFDPGSTCPSAKPSLATLRVSSV